MTCVTGAIYIGLKQNISMIFHCRKRNQSLDTHGSLYRKQNDALSRVPLGCEVLQ